MLYNALLVKGTTFFCQSQEKYDNTHLIQCRNASECRDCVCRVYSNIPQSFCSLFHDWLLFLPLFSFRLFLRTNPLSFSFRPVQCPGSSFPVVPVARGLTFTRWGLCANELAHIFSFCSCACFCLYGPFNCMSFHQSSRHLSAFSLCSTGLISALLVRSTMYHFMKVSLSPYIILCG